MQLEKREESFKCKSEGSKQRYIFFFHKVVNAQLGKNNLTTWKISRPQVKHWNVAPISTLAPAEASVGEHSILMLIKSIFQTHEIFHKSKGELLDTTISLSRFLCQNSL